MTANQASRIDPHTQASLFTQPLDDHQLQQAISMLRQIFQSNIGPKGRLKYLHNNSGGHVTVTTCSGRLLHSMSVKKPALKLVTAAVQEHLRLYADGGNLAGLVCLLLVEGMLSHCAQLHRKLTAEIYEVLLGWCTDILNRQDSDCHHSINFSSHHDLKVLANSVVGSKVGCLLFGAEKEHIVGLLVDAFLNVFTAVDSSGISSNIDSVRFLCIEGAPPSESCSIEGLLFESPHIPIYRSNVVCLKKLTTGNYLGFVSVALFNISLSGDSDDFVDAVYELNCDIDLEDGILEKIAKCFDWLVGKGVGLLACQKVVHPLLKQQLGEQGMMCLDRLGLPNAKRLCRISGCRPLSVLEPSLLMACDLGHLTSVNHRVINNKSYLQLQGSNPDSCGGTTVLLSHWSEEALQEMQYVCETAMCCMEQTSQTGLCLTGGGCWQAWLAHALHMKALRDCGRNSQEIGCTKMQFLQATSAFVSCLEKLALAVVREEDGTAVRDNKYFHLWNASSGITPSSKSECQCGAYTVIDSMDFSHLTQERIQFEVDVPLPHHRNEQHAPKSENQSVLDSFLPAINALRTGVCVANMIITIGQFIHDDN